MGKRPKDKNFLERLSDGVQAAAGAVTQTVSSVSRGSGYTEIPDEPQMPPVVTDTNDRSVVNGYTPYQALPTSGSGLSRRR